MSFLHREFIFSELLYVLNSYRLSYKMLRKTCLHSAIIMFCVPVAVLESLYEWDTWYFFCEKNVVPILEYNDSKDYQHIMESSCLVLNWFHKVMEYHLGIVKESDYANYGFPLASYQDVLWLFSRAYTKFPGFLIMFF